MTAIVISPVIAMARSPLVNNFQMHIMCFDEFKNGIYRMFGYVFKQNIFQMIRIMGWTRKPEAPYR